LYIKGRVEVDGDAEKHEVGVGGDDSRLCVEEIQAGAVDAQVGEERWAGGAEGHLDLQAAACAAPGGGGVAKVGDVAPHVEGSRVGVTVGLENGRRNPGGGGHGRRSGGVERRGSQPDRKDQRDRAELILGRVWLRGHNSCGIAGSEPVMGHF
jgi:hypothetical protein